MSLLLFGLGLRAPGVVTAQDYMNLNNAFQSPPDSSQVSLLVYLSYSHLINSWYIPFIVIYVYLA